MLHAIAIPSDLLILPANKIQEYVIVDLAWLVHVVILVSLVIMVSRRMDVNDAIPV